jgi:peroxin-6
VVKYAAPNLGMHVVEYNCYELLGPSEGKTAAAVVQAFEVARRFYMPLHSPLYSKF